MRPSLIIGASLLGFLVNGSWYFLFQSSPKRGKASATATGIIATLAIFASFLFSVQGFLALSNLPEGGRVIQETLFQWIHAGSLRVDLAFTLDPLSSAFTLVITGVGTLIHIYSIGYMNHDESPGRFFSYLNLFCSMMLILVLGSNLPVLFLGWEGVGLCSYLLISYWYTDIEKAKAGKKAFIVNRVGDVGFMLGMFLCFTQTGTLDFEALTKVSAEGAPLLIGGGLLLFFFACTGKSAQIPLYVWLPDAMAGPTPVSALIHAATMVTSGIYLLSRLSPLLIQAPTTLEVIATIGALTAFLAATIAVAQNDIKKILAYSTVSQLGLMFLACGLGAFGTGVFHVITHAFFKALLFLGAGSVIHGMAEEQDVGKMGALRKIMPKTALTMFIALLAISGIPPLSGFFSKDEILFGALSSHHYPLWIIGVLTSFLTAIYMARLYARTFLGTARWDIHHPPHESPLTMTLPLMVLAVLSAAGGILGLPGSHYLEHWLSPVVAHLSEGEAPHSLELFNMVFSACVGLTGVVLGMKLFTKTDAIEKSEASFLKALKEKWYVDEIYDRVFVNPLRNLSAFIWKVFDTLFIDGFVVGTGRMMQWAADTGRGIQTGSLHLYLLVLVLGLLVLMGSMLYAMV